MHDGKNILEILEIMLVLGEISNESQHWKYGVNQSETEWWNGENARTVKISRDDIFSPILPHIQT